MRQVDAVGARDRPFGGGGVATGPESSGRSRVLGELRWVAVDRGGCRRGPHDRRGPQDHRILPRWHQVRGRVHVPARIGGPARAEGEVISRMTLLAELEACVPPRARREPNGSARRGVLMSSVRRRRCSSDQTEAVELMLPPPLTFPEHVAVGVKVGERLLAWPRNRHHQLRVLQELIASVAVPTDAWGSVDPRGAGGWQAAGAELPAKIRDSSPL
jgi:hypothetical protein